MAANPALEYPQLLHAMFDCMGEGLYAIDSAGHVLLINPTACKILGYAQDELIGRVMHDTTHYKHRDGTLFPKNECAGFKVITEGHTVSVAQDFFIRKDGSFVAVSYTSSPIQRDGKVLGAVVAFQDLSARLEQEVALRKAEQHLHLAYQAAAVGAWEWDVSSNTLSLSPEFAQIVGLTDLMKMPLQEFSSKTIFYDSDRRLLNTTLQQTLRTRKEFQVEFRIRRNKEVRWMLMAGKAFYNFGNVAVLGVCMDTTELKTQGE